jgi:hypothetical protein
MFDQIATAVFVLLSLLLGIDAGLKCRSTGQSMYKMIIIVSIVTALSFLNDWTSGIIGVIGILILRFLLKILQRLKNKLSNSMD